MQMISDQKIPRAKKAASRWAADKAKKILPALLFLFCAASLRAHGNSTAQVVVFSEDADLKDELTSYISREIRSIGDIEVTDAHALYVVYVVAERDHGRVLMGATLTMTMSAINEFLTDCKTEGCSLARESLDVIPSYLTQRVSACADSDTAIRSMVASLVTYFDAHGFHMPIIHGARKRPAAPQGLPPAR